MNDLNDLSTIEKYDLGKSLVSISNFPLQCESAWNDVKSLSIPSEYRNCNKILFCGMGGSAYGARLIKSLYGPASRVPFDLVSDYNLPGYCDSETLIFVSSYSGGTEEAVSCLNQALKTGAKVIGISSGGELAEILKKNSKPVYIFEDKFNPSKQPRLGQGYMQIGQIAVLSKLGYINVTDEEIIADINNLNEWAKRLEPQTPAPANPAKKLASELENKAVILIGAGFLEGAIHSIRNPFHETGKQFATYFIVPEANHHLMEGLMFPESNRENLIFVLVNSDLYTEKHKIRMALTEEVVNKNSIPTLEIKLASETVLGQSLELIQLGSYVTFYLAMLHGIDPAKIPWVDYFKQKLKERAV